MASSLQNFKRKRKWMSWSAAIVLAGVLLAANFIVGFSSLRWDASEGNIYSLSEGSKDLMSSIPDNLLIKVYISDDLPPELHVTEKYIRDLLTEYRRSSDGKVTVTYLNPQQNQKIRQEAVQSQVYPVPLNVIRKDRQEVIESFMGMVIQYGDQSQTIAFVQDTNGLEYEISQRIKKLINPEEVRIGIITSGSAMKFQDEVLSKVGEALNSLYLFDLVDLNNEIPEGVKSLWWLGPTEEITEEERQRLADWVQQGGSLGLLLDTYKVGIDQFRAQPITTGINPLLNSWGVNLTNGLVADRRSDSMRLQSQQGMVRLVHMVQYPYFPLLVDLDRTHSALKNIDAVSFPFGSPIEITNPLSRLTYRPLAHTSEFSWLDEKAFNISPLETHEKMEGDKSGPFTCGMIIEGPFSDSEGAPVGRVVLFGSSKFIRTDYPIKESNLLMFFNFLDWSVQDSVLLSIRSPGIQRRPIKPLSDIQRFVVKSLMIGLLPLLTMICGLLVWTFHKRRISKIVKAYQEAA